jgi:hypothetical protein
MLTVDHYAQIRLLGRDGWTIQQIASHLTHSPKRVLKTLRHSEPPPPPVTRSCPVFGPFRAIVDALVAGDTKTPPKQRHSAPQIFRLLVAEHDYRGQYDQVRRYLQHRRLEKRETFIPLDHPPGRRCEADFGHIHGDFPDGRQLVPVLIVTWSYSNAPFAIALPTERTEAVLHGLREAFDFSAALPKELRRENPTTVAIHLGRGRTLDATAC